ncbi:MAG: hypothetical protein WA697_04200, partial [Pseudolabrys sp.]
MLAAGCNSHRFSKAIDTNRTYAASHVDLLAGEHDRYPMHLVRSGHLGAFTGRGLLGCGDLR